MNVKRIIFLLVLISALNSCGGGGGSSGGGNDGACDGSCANQSLSVGDVEAIVGRATKAAASMSAPAIISIVDRVGHVLAVYQMSGASATTRIDGQVGASGGLEQAVVPAVLAAISKAGTGAYLSSQGNAFSTRTASQIVQENFLPGESRQPGGPLFGVQFSQLPCSDLMNRNSAGPKPLPLGLAGDPGGIPLYKEGDLVGGVGIELNGLYTVDRDIRGVDADNREEEIALAAAFKFQAPSNRRADQIFAGGKSLRFTDADYPSTDPVNSGEVAPTGGSYTPVAGFFNGSVRAGVVFGTPESGILKTVRAGSAAAILASVGDGTRNGASLGGSEIRADEVSALLDSALLTADRARAAIRRPLDTRARVSISVVDQNGTLLGLTRSEDAPVFGIDVSLQKARTAAFFSSPGASTKLASFGGYANSSKSFAGRDLFNGSIAVTARAIGNMSRPFFPDGINGNGNGPLSLPFPGSAGGSSWSPFNTGLQLDLIFSAVVAPLSGNIPSSCSSGSIGRALANGIQIFPGAVPLYRGTTLIGAIGVSGDGIDQDDMISYFGASREGLTFAGYPNMGDATLGFNAPYEMRIDTVDLSSTDTQLRYVSCPEGPFIEDNGQNVCK
jgi:uncharacterized protein GlcG (DUF336 family)